MFLELSVKFYALAACGHYFVQTGLYNSVFYTYFLED